jgi:vancomycin permeability regulator SanA
MRWKTGIAGLAAGLVASILAIVAVNVYVGFSTAPQRYTSAQAAPRKPVALVFGAGLEADGTPSAVLADRLDAAIELYRRGRVEKLLLSGDNGSHYYNEVGAMQRYAVEHGIPAQAITLDYAGFNTYASCYRAHDIFGVRAALLVTQRYHLPRATYLCRRLGIDAAGVGTPDWGRFPASMMVHFVAREYLATVLASWDVNVTHPKPKFLGPYEGLGPPKNRP